MFRVMLRNITIVALGLQLAHSNYFKTRNAHVIVYNFSFDASVINAISCTCKDRDVTVKCLKVAITIQKAFCQ